VDSGELIQPITKDKNLKVKAAHSNPWLLKDAILTCFLTLMFASMIDDAILYIYHKNTNSDISSNLKLLISIFVSFGILYLPTVIAKYKYGGEIICNVIKSERHNLLLSFKVGVLAGIGLSLCLHFV